MKPTNNGPFADRSYAVDGSGRIIRPGNRVAIRVTLADVADRGEVVNINRHLREAEVDIGTGETKFYSVSRLSRMDGPEPDGIWVFSF